VILKIGTMKEQSICHN